MLRQALASLQGNAAALTAAIVLLGASTAFAQDLDVSSIAKDDVKKEAEGSGSWLPSLGGSSSSSAPAVASGSSSVAWYDPLGLFTGASEPAEEPVRQQKLGVGRTYQGSTRDTSVQIKTTGGQWWDPLEIFYQSEESVEYEDVNGFLNQPRVGEY